MATLINEAAIIDYAGLYHILITLYPRVCVYVCVCVYPSSCPGGQIRKELESSQSLTQSENICGHHLLVSPTWLMVRISPSTSCGLWCAEFKKKQKCLEWFQESVNIWVLGNNRLARIYFFIFLKMSSKMRNLRLFQKGQEMTHVRWGSNRWTCFLVWMWAADWQWSDEGEVLQSSLHNLLPSVELFWSFSFPQFHCLPRFMHMAELVAIISI